MFALLVVQYVRLIAENNSFKWVERLVKKFWMLPSSVHVLTRVSMPCVEIRPVDLTGPVATRTEDVQVMDELQFESPQLDAGMTPHPQLIHSTDQSELLYIPS